MCVQVDCQSGVGLVGSVKGGGAVMARRYHASLEASIGRHFPGNHAINCMCHSTENLYQMRDTAIVRASDDFYPREEASSHPHIAACAYNSLFFGPLFQPDWDMFQSLHPAARLHACARAVSGGAVYVSDKVGKHDYAILRQLVLRDGTVLRAARPGLPTEDSIFRDPLRDNKSILKVGPSCCGFKLFRDLFEARAGRGIAARIACLRQCDHVRAGLDDERVHGHGGRVQRAGRVLGPRAAPL